MNNLLKSEEAIGITEIENLAISKHENIKNTSFLVLVFANHAFAAVNRLEEPIANGYQDQGSQSFGAGSFTSSVLLVVNQVKD